MPFLSSSFITKNKAIAKAFTLVHFPFAYLLKSDSQIIFFTNHSIPTFTTSKFKTISSDYPLSTMLHAIREQFSDIKFDLSQNEFVKWELDLMMDSLPLKNIRWLFRIEYKYVKKEYFEFVSRCLTTIHQVNLFAYSSLRYEVFNEAKKNKREEKTPIHQNLVNDITSYMQKMNLSKREFYLLKREEFWNNESNLFSLSWRGERNDFDLSYQTTCFIGYLAESTMTLIKSYNSLGRQLKNILLNIGDGQSHSDLKKLFFKVKSKHFTYNGCKVRRLDGKIDENLFKLNNFYLIKTTWCWDNFPYYFCDVIKIDKNNSYSLLLASMEMLVFHA